MGEAMAYAESVGGVTLEMTVSGRALSQMNRALPRMVMAPLWRMGSAHFARGTNGPAAAFLRSPRASSIWNRVERPILQQRGILIEIH